MLVGFCIAVGVNGSTLVDLQPLPRWSVFPLTCSALAIYAIGCRGSSHYSAPIINGAHGIPTSLHELCIFHLHLVHVPLSFQDILGSCITYVTLCTTIVTSSFHLCKGHFHYIGYIPSRRTIIIL